MSSVPSSPSEVVPCPFCQRPMESGCVYGADRGVLAWMAGAPNWEKNLYSGVGDGILISEHQFLAGTFARGHHCPSCRRIVLAYG